MTAQSIEIAPTALTPADVVAAVSSKRAMTPDELAQALAADGWPLRELDEVHDERCCMAGASPGWGPHPDCPGLGEATELMPIVLKEWWER